MTSLGLGDSTKMDEFSEKIQMAFDPLPGFSIFPKNRVFYKAQYSGFEFFLRMQM